MRFTTLIEKTIMDHMKIFPPHSSEGPVMEPNPTNVMVVTDENITRLILRQVLV